MNVPDWLENVPDWLEKELRERSAEIHRALGHDVHDGSMEVTLTRGRMAQLWTAASIMLRGLLDEDDMAADRDEVAELDRMLAEASDDERGMAEVMTRASLGWSRDHRVFVATDFIASIAWVILHEGPPPDVTRAAMGCLHHARSVTDRAVARLTSN